MVKAKSINSIKYQFKSDPELCPLECESFRYKLIKSSGEYPSRNYAKHMLATNSVQIMDMRMHMNKTNQTAYEMLKNSFSTINIKFDSLAITETVEQPTISFTSLISNFGGILGLFIALSFLSIMEIFEFAFITTYVFHQVHNNEARVRV